MTNPVRRLTNARRWLRQLTSRGSCLLPPVADVGIVSRSWRRRRTIQRRLEFVSGCVDCCDVDRAMWLAAGAVLTQSHDTSRGSPHSRSISASEGAVSPGQSVFTTSFATRRPRVQIPPAPQTPWSGRCRRSRTPLVARSSSSVAPRMLHKRCMTRAPRRLRGAFSLCLTSVMGDIRARVADAGNRRFGSQTDGPVDIAVRVIDAAFTRIEGIGGRVLAGQRGARYRPGMRDLRCWVGGKPGLNCPDAMAYMVTPRATLPSPMSCAQARAGRFSARSRHQS